jgi:CheY-like chemotaxis protein
MTRLLDRSTSVIAVVDARNETDRLGRALVRAVIPRLERQGNFGSSAEFHASRHPPGAGSWRCAAAAAVARILIQPDSNMFLTMPRSSALQPTQTCDALRVLLVDDDSLVRWAIGYTLIQHGCLVVEDKDGESAIRSVADPSSLFDVILLDFPLAEGDGLDVLTALKQLSPKSRVLLMSTGISADDLAEAVRRGAAAFVPKPFDLDDVWTLVRRYGRSAD